MVTVTAVRPPARFGEILITGKLVSSFKEKPQVNKGWINGGFFVAKSNFLNLLKIANYTRKRTLESVAFKKELAAYKHYNFWKCMDTLRDREELLKIYKKTKFR